MIERDRCLCDHTVWLQEEEEGRHCPVENGVGETRAAGFLGLATITPKSLAFPTEYAEKTEHDYFVERTLIPIPNHIANEPLPAVVFRQDFCSTSSTRSPV